MPNITGRFLISAGHEPGTYAAFPSYADNCFYSDYWDSGELLRFVAAGALKDADDDHKTATWFSAARSNAIYGASESVQPPAVKVAVLIKHD